MICYLLYVGVKKIKTRIHLLCYNNFNQKYKRKVILVDSIITQIITKMVEEILKIIENENCNIKCH